MRHRGWRLIRQHGRRGRSGQVSAVATILALLLFVSFLSTFVFGQLGRQMTQKEFQHELQVEDQMLRLQTAVLQAADIWQPPSVGQSSPPAWNQGNLCTTLTASSCLNSQSNVCPSPLTWNESAASNSSFTFQLTGTNDCTRLNLTGNYDLFTLAVTGSSVGYLVVTLYGFHDTLLLNSGFTGTGFHAWFYLYGASNTYQAVGGPTGTSLALNTFFIGESASSPTCPFSNSASTDSWSISGSTASNSVQNLTWYNAIGYSTSYTTTNGWPGVGNTGTLNKIGWQNVSTPIPCAFARTTILGGGGAVDLSSPVTLGSGAVPPFGAPSTGYLQPEVSVSSLSAGLGLANITPAPPIWNTGSKCFKTGNGTCSGNNGPVIFWNFSGNHSTLSPSSTGCGNSGCTTVYNVSGSFDTIGLTVGGGAADNSTQNVIFVVDGVWDNMTLNLQGSCKNFHQVSFLISGTNDTYALNVGSKCLGGAAIDTLFLGSKGFICPYGNGALTDRFLGANWGSSSGVVQNITWRNAIGYVSAPHTILTNGGTDRLTFANQTGFAQCPFTKAESSGPYTLDYLSGIKAHLNNRYLPQADVVYDEGAIILGVQRQGSVMISPPQVSVSVLPQGVTLQLTLVNIVGSAATATGVGTAAVLTRVLSDSTFHIFNGENNNEFLTFLNLSIETTYPLAWATFWNSQSLVAPVGTTCVPAPGVPMSQCLIPPDGRASTIIVPLAVQELFLHTVTVSIGIY
jgi:hypothetical protein